MDGNNNTPGSHGDEEKKRREMDEFLNEYWGIRAEMVRLEEEGKIYYGKQKRFLARFMPELKGMVNRFYPEYATVFPVVKTELTFFCKMLFDNTAKLCDHYKEGHKGYYGELHGVEFKITTTLDSIVVLEHAPKYMWIKKVAENRFEEEYVNGFYYGSYKKHIHLLLKRLLTDYIPEIYDLPANGLRELDGLLFAAMFEILDIIEEAPLPGANSEKEMVKHQ
jgi:hypothetical protein